MADNRYQNLASWRAYMVSRVPKVYKLRAQLIKALAHPTRLFIVDQLAAKGEMCVCELTNLIGDDISTVSRHLSVLKSSGILSDDKRGVAVYYSLRIKCAQGFLECAESVMKHDLKDRDSARR